MNRKTNTMDSSVAAISLSIPTSDPDLSKHKATGDILLFLTNHRFSDFSLRELATQLGLIERETAEKMKDLYSENRTESYYGGGRPTDEQADAMTDLGSAVHQFAVSQVREDGVCLCD